MVIAARNRILSILRRIGKEKQGPVLAEAGHAAFNTGSKPRLRNKLGRVWGEFCGVPKIRIEAQQPRWRIIIGAWECKPMRCDGAAIEVHQRGVQGQLAGDRCIPIFLQSRQIMHPAAEGEHVGTRRRHVPGQDRGVDRGVDGWTGGVTGGAESVIPVLRQDRERIAHQGAGHGCACVGGVQEGGVCAVVIADHIERVGGGQGKAIPRVDGGDQPVSQPYRCHLRGRRGAIVGGIENSRVGLGTVRELRQDQRVGLEPLGVFSEVDLRSQDFPGFPLINESVGDG